MISLFRLTYSSLHPTSHDGYARCATRNGPQRIAKSHGHFFDEVSR